jgi:ribosomal protein L29
MATKVKKEKENLKGMDKTELTKKLKTLREDLRVKKFKIEGGKAGNVKESMFLRKKIARILTEINKKS